MMFGGQLRPLLGVVQQHEQRLNAHDEDIAVLKEKDRQPAQLASRPTLTEERLEDILRTLREAIRAEIEQVHNAVADLEREIAQNRMIVREVQAVANGQVEGTVARLPRARPVSD